MTRTSLPAFLVLVLALTPLRAQEADQQKTAPKPKDECTDSQKEIVKKARGTAFSRSMSAHEKTIGLGPPAPPGRIDPAEENKAKARRLAKKLFQKDLDMDDVGNILGKIKNTLVDSNLPVVCPPASDDQCGNRAGYVVDGRLPLHLCPQFFKDSDEQQIRTLHHEAAHVAGVGDSSPGAEGAQYCIIFDCETPCGSDENVADSWAQFIHCMSGQEPDKPEVIKGDPNAPKKP